MFGQKRLRILHCVRAPIGGIFRHIVDLALAQEAAGHAVGIVCDASTGGAFEDTMIAGIEPQLSLGVTRLSMRRQIGLQDVAAAARLFRTVRGLAPDVLHGHGSKGGAYARVIGTAMRLSGRRTLRIYCPHGGSLHFDAGSAEGRTYFRIERGLARLTDAFVFVSAYEEAQYVEKVGRPSRPAKRVYNGLRPGEFEPIVPGPAMADLMCVGMVRDLKGQRVLVEALRVLRDVYRKRPTLRLVGDGEDREALRARVAELRLDDQITFLDPMPTRDALSQGRTIVVPSLAESMPYIVLEAAAARIPMVATRVGGIPEIFGESADRLIQPGDANALADRLRTVLDNEASARGEAERLARAIAGRFSVERMAADIETLYADLLAGRPVKGATIPARQTVPLELDRAA